MNSIMNKIKKAVRTINMNLNKLGDEANTIVFVTTNSLIAQCTIIANLAIMFGQSDESTVILDLDLEHDYFFKTFQIKNTKGVMDFINGTVRDIEQITNSTAGQNVSVIVPGTVNDQSSDFLLGDQKLVKLIRILSEKYQHVLINTTKYKKGDSYGVVFDVVNNAILVERTKDTPKKDVSHLIRMFRHQKAKILGYVVASR